ncbi:MAG: RimK family alpha-L-glutamate ligase, partial [Candidatus Nanoarchaeia archaeon]
MKIDIIGKRHNWENMAILKSLRERGVDTDFLHPRRLSYRLAKGKIDIFHKRKPYELPDLVFSRLVPAGGRYFLNTLIGLGVKVPEPAPVVGRDKLVYATIFALHNIPHPITICGGDKTLDLIDFSPVVCKPSHGSQGHHITRHKSIRMARGLDYLLQPMISNRHEDLRVICLGGKVLGTTKRIAAKNKWKTNVAQGGKSVHVRTTP